MKFLVLGAGQMGYAVAYDLIRSPGVDKVALADFSETRLNQINERLSDNRIVPCKIDVNKIEEVASLMSGFDIAISCVTYRHNYDLAKAALEAGTNFCDLGGNEDIVAKEFMLSDLAKQRGIAIVPDCGLAPGLVSILATAAAQSMDELYEIRLRVGGLPIQPQEPLNYALAFSVDGLINEYMEEATIIRDGRMMKIQSLTETEVIHFPAPFHQLEAFSTSGGISTLPKTYAGKVQHLDYKTIRYPGHCNQIRLLRDLGLFDNQPIKVDSTSIEPRNFIREMLQTKLPKNEPDVVLVRVIVSGVKNGATTQNVWDCIDYMDEAAGLSAMMRMTAFPASIIAQLIARGDIKDKGTLTQEGSIPYALFLAELTSRGINLVMSESQ